VPRRELSAGEIAAVVQREIDERVVAAEQAAQYGSAEQGERLRAEASVLGRFVQP